MSFVVERLLARRYLKARRGFISITTWFAIVGIALGVATLILVTSLMNGIREDMTQRFIGIEGHATVYKPSLFFDDYPQVAEEIASIEGVESVTAKVEGQVMATYQGRAQGAQVVAMPWSAISKRSLFMDALKVGSWDAYAKGEGVLIGHRLARSLGLRVGDAVTLISPQGQATIAGFIPRMKAYPIVGLLDFGMHLYDGGLILMPFDQAQTYFKLEREETSAVSNLEIMVRDVNEANHVAQQISGKLGGAFYVTDWQQSNAGIFQALLVQRNVMVIILALIILVAAFNIISSLVMLVKEKRRDIAILRTMGATRSMVMRIFVMSGVWIGVVGTLAGLVLGLVLAANIERIKQLVEAIIGQEILVADIYFLSTLPTKTDPIEVLVIITISLVIALLAALYPARQAARLDPAEVLRDV
ncbi:MAG: lipoprotein-releasing ABC transporter permease subunit [Rickettsiales bacterium]